MRSPLQRQSSMLAASVRVDFIRRTYQHLAWAVLGFIVVEALLLQWSGAQVLVRTMTGGYSWFIVLAAFMGVSWLAEKWARSEASPQMQYAGLALFVVAEAIIFLPLLYIAAYFSSPNVIPTAGIVTALLFGGLTYIAFTTRRDFSFLGNILSLGGFVALGVIVASMLFGLNLGVFFAGLMVAYAGAAILYNTSNIMHRVSSRSARGSSPGAVRFRSPHVLVRAAYCHGTHWR